MTPLEKALETTDWKEVLSEYNLPQSYPLHKPEKKTETLGSPDPVDRVGKKKQSIKQKRDHARDTITRWTWQGWI